MDKISFNKENITELFSQIVKILEREGNTSEIPKLIHDVKKISNSVQIELKKSKAASDSSIKSIIKKHLSCRK